MLDKEKEDRELCDCIEKMEKLFLYDTITLLDCVLTDDPDDPEYSANMAYSRLETVMKFQSLYFGEKTNDVASFMLKEGYTQDDVDLFMANRMYEDRRHGYN